MAHLISPIKAINNLYFGKWKSGTIFKGVDVLVSDEGRVVIIRDKVGRLYCNLLKDYAYLPGTWRFNEPVLNGLVRMGVLAPEAAKEHVDYCAKVEAERNRKYAVERLRASAQELGITLTPSQLRRIGAE